MWLAAKLRDPDSTMTLLQWMENKTNELAYEKQPCKRRKLDAP